MIKSIKYIIISIFIIQKFFFILTLVEVIELLSMPRLAGVRHIIQN